MAKRKNVGLSAGFDTSRLDAIGSWKIVPDSDNLWIDWRKPVTLQGDWVPMDLRFATSYEEIPPDATFDPDDRMFELYELFRSQMPKFVLQLRDVVTPAEEVVGSVVRARVEVDRYDDEDPDMCHCYLRVSFKFTNDDEHSSFSRLDPDTKEFQPLEG